VFGNNLIHFEHLKFLSTNCWQPVFFTAICQTIKILQ